ncbi:DUF2637 domain-containing protein [Nonomuraea sp. 10N515B]|uniref:DUF2637 domain-containing protein n=1 Tax=Nonomuraea sp. 10N515B TaxID=3457422 RepID=UPI003FCC8CB2
MEDTTPCVCSRNRTRLDRIIRWTTTLTVAILAAIAAVISYRHLHILAVRHGESPLSAALLPLSVDGMILASSMALLADSRRGGRGGPLPWLLLIVGSLASVAANIAVAEPSLIGRAVAAWPALALIGGMEMAFRLVRQRVAPRSVAPDEVQATAGTEPAGRALQREAWKWALSNRDTDGSLPASVTLAQRFSRSTRWARLVKAAGTRGALN